MYPSVHRSIFCAYRNGDVKHFFTETLSFRQTFFTPLWMGVKFISFSDKKHCAPHFFHFNHVSSFSCQLEPEKMPIRSVGFRYFLTKTISDTSKQFNWSHSGVHLQYHAGVRKFISFSDKKQCVLYLS